MNCMDFGKNKSHCKKTFLRKLGKLDYRLGLESSGHCQLF